MDRQMPYVSENTELEPLNKGEEMKLQQKYVNIFAIVMASTLVVLSIVFVIELITGAYKADRQLHLELVQRTHAYIWDYGPEQDSTLKAEKIAVYNAFVDSIANAVEGE